MPGFEFFENGNQQVEASAVTNLFSCVQPELLGGQLNRIGESSTSTIDENNFPELKLFDSTEDQPETEGPLDNTEEYNYLADSTAKQYLPETVSTSEFEAVKKNHHYSFGNRIDARFSKDQLLEIKEDINAQGVAPRDLLTEAMSRSRLLCVGENHYKSDDLRDTLTDSMKSLKTAGATHLAIEVNESMQGKVEQFLIGDIQFHQIGLEGDVNNNHFKDMLLAAKDAGLEVRCVDRKETGFMGVRNNFMSANLRDILDANDQNKVVFLVGASHLTKGMGSTSLSVPEQMTGFTAIENGVTSHPYRNDVYNINANPEMELHLLTQNLNAPVGVDIYKTRQSFRDFPASVISSNKAGQSSYASNSDFDAVILFK